MIRSTVLSFLTRFSTILINFLFWLNLNYRLSSWSLKVRSHQSAKDNLECLLEIWVISSINGESLSINLYKNINVGINGDIMTNEADLLRLLWVWDSTTGSIDMKSGSKFALADNYIFIVRIVWMFYSLSFVCMFFSLHVATLHQILDAFPFPSLHRFQNLHFIFR